MVISQGGKLNERDWNSTRDTHGAIEEMVACNVFGESFGQISRVFWLRV